MKTMEATMFDGHNITKEDLDNVPDTNRARIYHICEALPPGFATRHVQAILARAGHGIARPTASKFINEWRRKNNIASTGEQVAMTEERLAELDEQFNPDPAEVAGVHRIADLTPPQRVNGSTPKPSIVKDDVTPHVDTPATPPVERQPDATPEPKKQKEEPAQSLRSRAWNWLVSKFIFLLYMGLLTYAAYGLFEVLHLAAGAPLLLAATGAASIELVGIACKLQADRAERAEEHRKVVYSLLAGSALVALIVAGANIYGHAIIDGVIAAMVYGLASVAGYGLWTINTSLAHRRHLRHHGKIKGPGVRIPDYATQRYGKDVTARAKELSEWNSKLNPEQAVALAREQLAEEAAERKTEEEKAEREAREADRRETLRKGLRQQAINQHEDPLAAELDIARFGIDQLADLINASHEDHQDRANALINWVAQSRTNK